MVCAMENTKERIVKKTAHILRWIPALVLALSLVAPWPVPAAELRLSVNASMREAVLESVRAFRNLHPDAVIVSNFAASGALARQMAAGAPADLFISANPEWMDFVVAQSLVATDQVYILATNRQVVVGSATTAAGQLTDLADITRIAIASPESAPAGRYAQQALRQAGLYDELRSAGRLILARDVRQALLYADRGEVDAAIIYATDARLARRAVILFEVPQELHEPIRYPMALTLTGQKKALAVAFRDFLLAEAGQAIFAAQGFVLTD